MLRRMKFMPYVALILLFISSCMARTATHTNSTIDVVLHVFTVKGGATTETIELDEFHFGYFKKVYESSSNQKINFKVKKYNDGCLLDQTNTSNYSVKMKELQKHHAGIVNCVNNTECNNPCGLVEENGHINTFAYLNNKKLFDGGKSPGNLVLGNCDLANQGDPIVTDRACRNAIALFRPGDSDYREHTTHDSGITTRWLLHESFHMFNLENHNVAKGKNCAGTDHNGYENRAILQQALSNKHDQFRICDEFIQLNKNALECSLKNKDNYPGAGKYDYKNNSCDSSNKKYAEAKIMANGFSYEYNLLSTRNDHNNNFHYGEMIYLELRVFNENDQQLNPYDLLPIKMRIFDAEGNITREEEIWDFEYVIRPDNPNTPYTSLYIPIHYVSDDYLFENAGDYRLLVDEIYMGAEKLDLKAGFENTGVDFKLFFEDEKLSLSDGNNSGYGLTEDERKFISQIFDLNRPKGFNDYVKNYSEDDSSTYGQLDQILEKIPKDSVFRNKLIAYSILSLQTNNVYSSVFDDEAPDSELFLKLFDRFSSADQNTVKDVVNNELYANLLISSYHNLSLSAGAMDVSVSSKQGQIKEEINGLLNNKSQNNKIVNHLLSIYEQESEYPE